MMTGNSTLGVLGIIRRPSVPLRLFMHFSSITRTDVLASTSPPCAGSLVPAFSHTLFSDALLIPPLHIYSAIIGPQLVLFSHHHRTDIPSSQHNGLAERIQTFRCQACHTTFSARRDTPCIV
jgi:hypothetical protein